MKAAVDRQVCCYRIENDENRQLKSEGQEQ